MAKSCTLGALEGQKTANLQHYFCTKGGPDGGRGVAMRSRGPNSIVGPTLGLLGAT